MNTSKNTVDQLMENTVIQECIKYLELSEEQTLEEQIDLACIEAPTNYEQERAEHICSLMESYGLESVSIDGGGNASGMLQGSEGNGCILVEAHMDTVFPKGTVTERPTCVDGVIRCPGIMDNARGVAVMLAVVRTLTHNHVKPRKNVLFAATAGEEGMGSLRGMRYLFENRKDITASISIDGGDFDNIVYCGTGVQTREFIFKGKGGHAYGAFGTVSQCLHAAARAVAKIADIQTPEEPKTTFAVTNFHAGNQAGIHSIADSASFVINYRSNGAEMLKRLHDEIEEAVTSAVRDENTRWDKETVTVEERILCNVPAGSIDRDTPIVQAMDAIIRHLGAEPYYAKGGCTNANIPISLGLQAVCAGSSNFDYRVHSLDEFFPIRDTNCKGAQQVLLLTMAMAGLDGGTAALADAKEC